MHEEKISGVCLAVPNIALREQPCNVHACSTKLMTVAVNAFSDREQVSQMLNEKRDACECCCMYEAKFCLSFLQAENEVET